MSKRAFERLQPHLLPGETLLWCGRPAKQFRLRWSHLALGVIALVVHVIWLVVMTQAIVVGGGEWVSASLMSVFTLLFWRGIISSWLESRHAVYAVTDRRIIVIISGLKESVRSIRIAALEEVTLTGTSAFGTVRCPRSKMPWKDQRRPGRVTNPALFRRISDAGAVCDLIREQAARYRLEDHHRGVV